MEESLAGSGSIQIITDPEPNPVGPKTYDLDPEHCMHLGLGNPDIYKPCVELWRDCWNVRPASCPPRRSFGQTQTLSVDQWRRQYRATCTARIRHFSQWWRSGHSSDSPLDARPLTAVGGRWPSSRPEWPKIWWSRIGMKMRFRKKILRH